MSTITVVVFDIGFILERWLRHVGRLARHTSIGQKVLSFLAIITSIIGGAGLILLSIFDTLRHHTLHDVFLTVFIAGYVFNAIFICWEYQRLGIHFREYKIIRASFWIKLVFIIVEVALAIAFGVTQRTGHYNVSAVLEWIIALIFTFYVLSFFIDFVPAVRTKGGQSRATEEEMATATADSQQPITENDHANRYGETMNGRANGGFAAGRHYAAPQYGNGNEYANGTAGHAKPQNGVLRAGQHF
jgi:Frag1/DRAM/Sfk1 family